MELINSEAKNVQGNFSEDNQVRALLATQVINSIELLGQAIRACGYSVETTRTEYHRIKTELDKEHLSRLAKFLSPLCHFLLSEVLNGEELDPTQPGSVDELRLLRKFLTFSKMRIPDELETYVRPGDVIEVYDAEGIQHYRSFNFFEICSYTLEEILTFEWWHLYERNEFVTRQLVNHFVKSFGERTNPYLINLPSHVAREISSPDRSTIRIRQTAIIPVQNLAGETKLIITPFKILERLQNYEGNIQTDLGH